MDKWLVGKTIFEWVQECKKVKKFKPTKFLIKRAMWLTGNWKRRKNITKTYKNHTFKGSITNNNNDFYDDDEPSVPYSVGIVSN